MIMKQNDYIMVIIAYELLKSQLLQNVHQQKLKQY